jgi:predicted Zn-dependent protease
VKKAALIVVGLIGLMPLSACETNEALGRSQLLLVSDDTLAPQALEAWSQALKTEKISTDAALTRRVNTVAARIVAAAGMGDRQWEYVLFDNPEPNAFVIPGNKVGVNTGLFQIVKNDDQLAAVIGHETGHVIAHHAAERASQQVATSVAISVASGAAGEKYAKTVSNFGGLGAQLGVLLPYSRTHELEADKLGVDLMAKAGYTPSQAVEVWRNMQSYRKGNAPLEMVSTHPSDETRIARLQAYIAEKGYK